MNDKSIDSSLKRLADGYFDATLKPVSVLYVDQTCFQDFNIGALLCLIKTEEEYKYVLSNIANYNARRKNMTMYYFPDIKITDEELSAFISDTKHHSVLERISPMTDYYKNFSAFSKAVTSSNALAKERVIPQLFIGCSVLQYSNTAKQKLIKDIKRNIPSWGVTITSTDVFNYSSTLLESMDHYTIFDINKFIDNPKLGALMQAGKIVVHRSIHAFPFIIEEDPELTEEQLLENAEIIYSMFSDFKFVTMSISNE